MGIEVSIIMNSYNRYPQCLYSLYALEAQTFSHSKMEVIFVDDASTDETPLLQNYTPPYTFKYIRCSKNQGRSKAKNIGIDTAEGNIIIMLDAEVIVEPDCVEQQYLYHQSEGFLAVTACLNHYSTYTVYDKQFSKHQINHFHRLAKNRIRKLPRNLQTLIRKNKFRLFQTNKLEFYTKEDIKNQKYKDLSFSNPFFPDLIKELGENFNDFLFPWIFVIPQKLSFKKCLIDIIGPFYEGFNGWGAEDWEFGYRLYKHGVKIIDEPKGIIYHQEHPRNVKDDRREGISNYLVFFKNHYSFDVGCVSLLQVGKDFLYVNELMKEYDRLSEEYPGKYLDLIDCLLHFFELILEQAANEKIASKLNGLYTMDKNKVSSVLYQREDLKKKGHYQYLINTIDYLFDL